MSDDNENENDGKLTRLNRKIIDASLSIEDPSNYDVRPEFLHSVLCQIGLPRSKPEGREFERHNGRACLQIQAGKLWKRGKFVDAPMPYGVKPRLVLIHACSEAIRNKSPVIEVGNSVQEFLQTLGLNTGGRGYKLFHNQMEALAACRMTIGMSMEDRDITIHAPPFDRFEAWLTHRDSQIAMWPGVLRLSPQFYETLTEHAVPLDPRALSALKSSALKLDIYTFLANRLCRVRKDDGVMLSWRNLRGQFGQEYGISKDFKKAYRKALKDVLAVYPAAKVRDVHGGIKLYPSPPPIKKTQVINLTKIKKHTEMQTELF